MLQIVYDKHMGAEFQSEVRTLARVEHMNLVRFYGFLEHEDERILVVEYVASGTLREHLDCEFLFSPSCSCIFAVCLDSSPSQHILDSAGVHGDALDFAARLDIAIDVAHAVTYLHMYTGFVYIFLGSHFLCVCVCVF